MTNFHTHRMAERDVAGQEDGAVAYSPPVTCPSDDCYPYITDPPRIRAVRVDGKGNAYVSTFDGKLFKVKLALDRRENEPPEPPELIASGLSNGTQNGAFGMGLDGKGNAYVVNSAQQLWRVPLDEEPPELMATGLDAQGSPSDVAVDWAGDYAYVVTSGGVLWRVSLRGEGQKKQVATNLGTTNDVVLDGKGRNAYVVNRAGVLWRVPLPAPSSDQLAVPQQVGPVIPGGGVGVAMDWVGKDAYVVNLLGTLWRVPLDGGQPEEASSGLGYLYTLELDERGNAYVVEVSSGNTGSRVWRIDGVASPSPSPTLSTPAPGAHTGRTVKFSGNAPGAIGVIVQDLHGTPVGSQTVNQATGYWAWALGENVLDVDLAAGGVGPVSHRGLPWDPGAHTLRFVAINDLGVTAPTPITFIVNG